MSDVPEEVIVSGPMPAEESVFRLFSDASDTILAECSECGRVLKIPRDGASRSDEGYLVADGFKCPCGRFGRSIAQKARPKLARSAETSMSGPMKGLLGMVGVAMVVWLAQLLGPSTPSVTGPPLVTLTNNSPPEVTLLFLDTGEREFPAGQVRLYTNLLDALDARCEQDRTMISDQSVMATRIIEQDQRPGTRRINNVTFLREWLEAVRALPADINRDCVPIAATLMAMLL